MAKDISQLFSEVIERNQHLLAKPINLESFFKRVSPEHRSSLRTLVSLLCLTPRPSKKVELEEQLRNHIGQPFQTVAILHSPELYEDVFITTRNEPFFYWVGRIDYHY